MNNKEKILNILAGELTEKEYDDFVSYLNSMEQKLKDLIIFINDNNMSIYKIDNNGILSVIPANKILLDIIQGENNE